MQGGTGIKDRTVSQEDGSLKRAVQKTTLRSYLLHRTPGRREGLSHSRTWGKTTAGTGAGKCSEVELRVERGQRRWSTVSGCVSHGVGSDLVSLCQ